MIVDTFHVSKIKFIGINFQNSENIKIKSMLNITITPKLLLVPSSNHA